MDRMALRMDGHTFTWRNLFLTIDRGIKLMEKLRLLPFRRRATDRAAQWMLAHFEHSAGMGAIFPPIVYSLIALRALGYEDYHPQVVRATKELEDLEIEEGRVFLRSDPAVHHVFKDLVHGYQYDNGNSVGGQILGRGSYIMNHLTPLDPKTGKGKPGPGWTVGVQVVEVEYDTKEFTYRLVKAATVIDAGKVINPKTARGLITGGMSMGLGMGSREGYAYGADGVVLDTSLRTYKVMHFGENPEYLVEFVETPQVDGPFGARGLAEHGVIGMPAALANALSSAAQVDLNHFPITLELIWKTKIGGMI
jgi:CO/xanthine dehydrogenase Mo-binding subunit